MILNVFDIHLNDCIVIFETRYEREVDSGKHSREFDSVSKLWPFFFFCISEKGLSIQRILDISVKAHMKFIKVHLKFLRNVP